MKATARRPNKCPSSSTNQRCVKSQKYLPLLFRATPIFHTQWRGVTASFPPHERHNQSAAFVICKLAMVGILAEDEGLWHYTTASYSLRSLHWSKPWLKLSSHPQCNKAATFPITSLNVHVGSHESSQKKVRRPTKGRPWKGDFITILQCLQ